jgi:hypothetical protein
LAAAEKASDTLRNGAALAKDANVAEIIDQAGAKRDAKEQFLQAEADTNALISSRNDAR